MRSGMMAAAAVLAIVMAGPAFAEGCDAVVAAQVKEAGLPTHSSITVATNGAAFHFESYLVGGKLYSKDKDGAWKIDLRDTDPAKIAKRWADDTCTQGGADTIDGETVDIVFEHLGGRIPMDMRFWISRTTGLIVKSETRMKNVVLTEVDDSNNVQAPSEALQAKEP